LNFNEKFSFSPSWLWNFKKRFNVRKLKISGKSDSINLKDYKTEIVLYSKDLSFFEIDKIFNVDELGLFYDKTIDYFLSSKSIKNVDKSKKKELA